MDQQNINRQNGNALRSNEPIANGEADKIKSFWKALAILIVFLGSFSFPFYCSFKAKEVAIELRIRMDMNQLKNWAEIYRLKHGTYSGLNDDLEVKRVFADIESMGGTVKITVDGDNEKYCSQSLFIKKDIETWCIDSSGHMGVGACDSEAVSCN